MKSIKNCRSSFLERKDAGFSNSPYGMVHTHRKTGKDRQSRLQTPFIEHLDMRIEINYQ